MALEELANSPTDIITNLTLELGKIGRWIQAIGLVIILWLIFQIIILINNRIKRKRLYTMEQKLERIEKKLDNALKKNKIK